MTLRLKPARALRTAAEGISGMEAAKGVAEMVMPQETRGHFTALLAKDAKLLDGIGAFAGSIAQAVPLGIMMGAISRMVNSI
ncbi:MAG: hypothetical protein PHG85_01945 [Candidatus Altiarchaeota archaeon]|nr:hypothetical protein [Candidatus Altiarchaeota archaeon]